MRNQISERSRLKTRLWYIIRQSKINMWPYSVDTKQSQRNKYARPQSCRLHTSNNRGPKNWCLMKHLLLWLQRVSKNIANTLFVKDELLQNQWELESGTTNASDLNKPPASFPMVTSGDKGPPHLMVTPRAWSHFCLRNYSKPILLLKPWCHECSFHTMCPWRRRNHKCNLFTPTPSKATTTRTGKGTN